MRRRQSFVSGIIVFILANCVVSLSEWNDPPFAKPDPLDDRVSWEERDNYPSYIFISIWEGITDDVTLTRLTLQPDGDTLPTVAYIGSVGLGVTIAKDDDPQNPVYVKATEAGDYDTGTRSFIVSLTLSSYAQRRVSIILENVNDNAPIIVSPEKCSFDEERLYDHQESTCVFTVTDIDGGACFVEPSVNDDHFELYLTSEKSRECTTATFVLKVVKELDYEKYRLHSLQIVIEDKGIIDEDPEEKIKGDPQTREITFVVDVNDMPDVPPVWETLIPYISVDEKTPGEESQFQMKATDGDFGLDWDIEYSLIIPSEIAEFEKYFKINEDGIFTVESIDRDEYQKEIFSVEVVATEIPDRINYPNFTPLSVQNTVVIMVNDRNDHYPEIISNKEGDENLFVIDEETSFSSEKTFSIVDPDLGENGQFNVELEENYWSDNFLLIPPSGYQKSEITITSVDPSKLDYEKKDWRIISLTIVSQEVADETHTRRTSLTIQLVDLIDEPPEFDEGTCITYRIEENQPKGYLVVNAEAHDPDENDEVKYTLKNNYIQIEENGDIRTTSEKAFDYERQPEIMLQVVAYDLANLRTFCEITIELIDLNDEAPTLVLPYTTDEIEEHSDVGFPASPTIEATDPDGTASLLFEIDWEKSVAYKQGVAVRDKTLYMSSVDLKPSTQEADGEFVTMLFVADKEKFDWEVFDTLKLQIDVIDINTHPDYEPNRKRSATMTVTVGDINDCEPVFTEETKDAEFTVNENLEAGRLVGAVLATDDDSEKYSQITYTIEPTFPEELVNEEFIRLTINKDTGQIYTGSTVIDCDEWQTLVYKYTVTASDTKYFTTNTITINIQDLNDNSPIVTEPKEEENYNITKAIEEHTPGNWAVGCIWGHDIDVTDIYHTITYYIEGTALKHFTMEKDCEPLQKCCLFVIDGNEMDREIEASHEIIVYSRDNFKDAVKDYSREGPVITMLLELIDINDKEPVFEDHKTFEVRENEELKNFRVGVTDDDEGINAQFDCVEDPVITVVRPGEPTVRDLEGVFKVDTEDEACVVYATQSLEGLWGTYTFQLEAIDRGEGPNHGYGEYTLVVINVNLNYPVIDFPDQGKSMLLDKEQTPNSSEPLKGSNGIFLQNFVAHDDDDPDTDNGKVDFILEGGENIFFLDPISIHNHAVLRMYDNPDSEKRKYSMSVIAKNKATLDPKESEEVFFDVWLLNSDSSPEFDELEPTVVEFEENELGMTRKPILPAAVNLDEEPLDVKRDIFYFIMEGDTTLFTLDKNSRELTLLLPLDYEEQTQHNLKIVATHKDDSQVINVYKKNVLEVTVQVIDQNDMPPVFTQELFPGTFSADQKIGQTVLQLEAIDPDVDDVVTYELIPGTVTAMDESLKQFESDTAFLVGSETGVVTLNFNPNGRVLSGYFEFHVVAYDTEGNVPGHKDEAVVNVFVVSDIHRVEFNFYNPVDAVDPKRKEMEEVFSEVLGYTCVVEEVNTADSSNNIETTDVLTHFIDNDDKSPVPRKNIEEQFLDEKIFRTLFSELSEYSLSFVGFSNMDPGETVASHTTTIVLAALCAVLGVLVFVFLLAFVVRTRTLNQRLEKLTKPKFGSQDSGLNRDGMVVPGTNMHALEGSNPVWNHDTVIDEIFDTMSRSSGDSDLVGIEDNPYFNDNDLGGTSNPAFEPQPRVNPYVTSSAPSLPLDGPRRTSLNPLATAAASEYERDGFDSRSNAGSLAMSLEDMDMPRRISLNPLVSDLDVELNAVEVDKKSAPVNSNFSFQLPPGEQVTDL